MSGPTEAEWREMARTPRGRQIVEEHRAKMQTMRDDYAATTREHLAEYDQELAMFANVLDGKSELQA